MDFFSKKCQLTEYSDIALSDLVSPWINRSSQYCPLQWFIDKLLVKFSRNYNLKITLVTVFGVNDLLT